MRIFRIDYTKTEAMLPDGYVLGNQGEHNATLLTVTPPDEMTENEEITSYRIAFELTNCRAVHSESIAKADVISLPLFSQITSSDTVSVQLEGYDTNGNIVVKSDKVTKLKFNPSVCGIEIPPSDSPNSMAAEVTKNSAFLKNFSEDENGNLTYKGKNIGSDSTNIKTVVLNNYDDFLCPTDISGVNSFAIFSLVRDENSEKYIPENVEIVSVELNIASEDDPEWVDLRCINKDAPIEVYVINCCKTFLDNVNNFGMFIASVQFLNIDYTNVYYEAMRNYDITNIRVRFIEP